MDYVCKVGTPSGEVVEQTFSAPDEPSLRSDLSDGAVSSRGLSVMSDDGNIVRSS